MRNAIWLPLVAILLSSATAWAQDGDYRQTRVNLTLKVPNFEYAAADLREVASQFGGHIQNMNLDHNSDSGNANVAVSEDQVGALVKQLSELGVVLSQNQSTNDNTNNIQAYARRAKAYKALSEIDFRAKFAKLPPDVRMEVQSEFESWLNSRLTSNESSLEQYKARAGQAEVYIQFTKEPNPTGDPQTVSGGAPDIAETPPPAPLPPPSHRESPAVYVLCLVNFLGLWLIYRRVDRETLPGLRD